LGHTVFRIGDAEQSQQSNWVPQAAALQFEMVHIPGSVGALGLSKQNVAIPPEQSSSFVQAAPRLFVVSEVPEACDAPPSDAPPSTVFPPAALVPPLAPPTASMHPLNCGDQTRPSEQRSLSVTLQPKTIRRATTCVILTIGPILLDSQSVKRRQCPTIKSLRRTANRSNASSYDGSGRRTVVQQIIGVAKGRGTGDPFAK